jgi:adenosylhomocysteine nucleosidase
MRTIGIIGAMDEEIVLLKEKAEITSVEHVLGLDFYRGKLYEKDIVLVRCGIGKVNAAACVQVLVDRFSVDCVINTGVAGAIYHRLQIGDIVISKDAVQHDMDTSVLGDPVGIIPRMEESYFHADKRLMALAKKASEQMETKHNIFLGRIASGDQFISTKPQKQRIWNTVGGYCAEMEGGAIAHVCYLNQIPFVIIRSISDKAEGEAVMDFAEFVHIAAKNSSELVENILRLMAEEEKNSSLN